MLNTQMTLSILLPYQVIIEVRDVIRIVSETTAGSMGILPNRLDFVAALVPGILIYETVQQEEKYLALDEGLLIKSGPEVVISVRNAIVGTDLGQLRETVDREMKKLETAEINVRTVLAKLESGFIRALEKFHQS